MPIFSKLFRKKKTAPPAKPAAPEPIALPDGTHVTRLFTYRSGCMMEPYYILCETPAGIYMKITDTNPALRDGLHMLVEKSTYFSGVDTVYDTERANNVKVQDEAVLREIESVIEKYGALGWDGFQQSRPLAPGQCDGDYYIRTYIELSDGTTVDMSGSNISPKGWGSFHYELENIFQKYAGFFKYFS